MYVSFIQSVRSSAINLIVTMKENRFAKCDICVKIKLERKECLHKALHNELRERHEAHLKRVE